MPVEAVLFDVIGTLFPLDPLRSRLSTAGLPREALEPWFAGSLRDLFALGVISRPVPMIEVLEANLRTLLARHGAPSDEARIKDVLAGMTLLDARPDAEEALLMLRRRGVAVMALSNGSLAATTALLDRAGLRSLVDAVASIDEVGRPKPFGAVYRFALDRLGVSAHAAALVAAHPWDVAGAAAAGLRTGFVSAGLPFPAVMGRPDATGATLVETVQELLA